MAIDYTEAEILAHQTEIQSYLHKSDRNYGQDIRKHEEWIMKQTQKIEQLKIEKEDFIRKLFEEEGIEW